MTKAVTEVGGNSTSSYYIVENRLKCSETETETKSSRSETEPKLEQKLERNWPKLRVSQTEAERKSYNQT